ncbi:NADH-quinone oxidoreductase subunit N [candidate division KSB1 bacterium]
MMEFTLPDINWPSIGSLLIMCGTGLTVLVLALFTKSLRITILVTFFGIVAALLYSVSIWGEQINGFGGMVIIDNFTLTVYIIVLVGSLLTLLLSRELLMDHRPIKGEYLALLTFSTLGMMIMAAAGDLVMIFLGVETLSIALYVLAGFKRYDEYSLEAALKYFLLGAFASGFLLYGMAYVYGAAGSTNLHSIITFLMAAGEMSNYFLVGFAFIIIGLAFKLAFVPFHMWTPDVYEGAPTPVAAFMSTGVKAAGFAVLIRIFLFTAGSMFAEWQNIIWLLAVLTMTVGNVIALSQTAIKRMLAYSSIAHAGYMLVAFIAGSDEAISSILYYLMTYTFMNIGAFGVVAYLERKESSLLAIKDYCGMGFKRPFIAAAMAIFMFSLAGIPPSAGFFAKFYVFRAAVNGGFIWLPVIGVLNSVISVYYYLRIVLNMYMKEPEVDFSLYRRKWTGSTALIISVIGVLILGILPSLFLNVAGSPHF